MGGRASLGHAGKEGRLVMTTTNSAHETETMRVPADLRWAVAKMVEMCDAGWEPCGFQGGGSGKVQFQKVEFRRRRDA